MQEHSSAQPVVGISMWLNVGPSSLSLSLFMSYSSTISQNGLYMACTIMMMVLLATTRETVVLKENGMHNIVAC
jgi:hypothetical protein